MKPCQLVLLLIALVSASVARANDCATAANTQLGMNECADMAYKKTDAELNAVYAQIRQRLKDDNRTAKLLVTAQRNWLAFRDAECAFSSSAGAEGSIYPLLVTQCRDGLTRKRIDDLKTYLHCGEGDMSCPVPAGTQ